ncbi:MAG: hypothetical protein DRO23_09005 [Thermoprotei archaeon]|nr:MAG: hypothetical protein DRO23_09005 [Thermoprotei archaeon]
MSSELHDEYLEKILEQLARKISRKVERKCCKRIIEVGYEVLNPRELHNIFNTCKAVFINFHSTTCPHCEMFKPIFLSVGKKYQSKAAFIRLNVLYAPEIAYEYGVLGVPTTIALIDGSVYDRIVGYVPKRFFEDYVKSVLVKAECLN